MKLIGMLDSPYVRRVAITLKRLGLPFAHESVSVFSTFEQFQRINPVVKAPTLVCDDGEVLMDSTLIIQYLTALSGADLMPAALPERVRALRIIGLALAACEKSVQIVYEHNLRPAEKLHAPWVDRVTGQLHAAYAELEKELLARPLKADDSIEQAGIILAVAWGFTRMMLGDEVTPEQYPQVADFTNRAEQLTIFRETPAT